MPAPLHMVVPAHTTSICIHLVHTRLQSPCLLNHVRTLDDDEMCGGVDPNGERGGAAQDPGLPLLEEALHAGPVVGHDARVVEGHLPIARGEQLAVVWYMCVEMRLWDG